MSTLDDLIEDMARLTDAPCTLEDGDFRLIGFSDHRHDDVVDAVRQRSILERRSTDEVRTWFREQGIEQAPGPLRIPGDAARGIVGRLCVPAHHLGRVHGYFWLLDPDGRVPESTWPEATRIADSAARLLSVAERRQAHRDALFRELVEGGRSAARESATELALAAGLELGDPVVCVLLQRPGLLDQVASRPARSGVVWARSGAGTVAAVAHADLLTSRHDLDGLLSALGLGRRLDTLDADTRAAVGPVARGMDDVATTHRGALVALRVARTRPAGGAGLVAWGDLGPLALLGVARDDDLRDAVLTPALADFLTTAGSDAVDTVRTWLEEAGSASRTAQRLAVHRQTVYHRITQVERATGLDLARGADRLRLHLALELAPFLS